MAPKYTVMIILEAKYNINMFIQYLIVYAARKI